MLEKKKKYSRMGAYFFGIFLVLFVCSLADSANAIGTVNIKARSCDDAACSSAGAVDESVVKAWANCGYLTNGNSLTSGSPNCVTNGDRYIQYQTDLSTPDTSQTPTLSDVTLGHNYYPTTFQKLVSSPFDTSNNNNSVQKLTWSASNDTTQGLVNFQIRTSADGSNWGEWCGPTTCGTSGGYASDYYTDKNGATAINSNQTDTSGNRYIQYATFLKSAEGDQAPTLSDVTVQYSYNVPPAISGVGYTQNPNGSVSVPYTLSETYDDLGNIPHGTASSPIKTLLVYSPDSGVTAPALTDSQTGIVTLNNPGSVPIPTQGTMLLDNELVAFDSVGATGNQRNITARAQIFTASYPTVAIAHSDSTQVYFVATRNTSGGNLIQTIDTLSETGTPGTDATAGGTFSWDAKGDPYLSLNSNKLENITFKVIANDADSSGVNNIGQSSATGAQTLDLQLPTIASVTSSAENGSYKASDTVALLVTFSENVNFDSTGGKTITLALNSGTCAIASSISNSAAATCSYVVGANDNTPEGQYLQVSSISTNGIITDVFSNQQTNFSVPSGQNISDSKQIIIDTVAPDVSDVLPAEDAYINSVTSANGGSDVSYTANEALKSGSYIRFTSTSGSDSAAQYTCTLQGTALNQGIHAAFALSQGANNCTESPNALVSGSTYTMQMHALDLAGNPTDISSANIIFDTTAPTASISSPASSARFNNVTDSSDFAYTLNENLSAATLTFTRTGGAADGSSPHICTLSGTELTSGDHNNVNLNNVCGGFSLTDETQYSIDLSATDLAGNVGNATQITNATYDITPPAISSFTSTTDNTCGASACGTGAQINITVNMNEAVASGSMVVRLSNTADPATDITLDQINGNQISGTYTVQGPNLGHDTDDLAIASVQSSNVSDTAGNVQTNLSIPVNLSDNKNIIIDTGPPVLSSFSAPEGSYNEGDSIIITADYSETLSTLNGGSSVNVTLSSGATLTLSTIASDKLRGTYVVGAGENAEALVVSSINSQNAVDLIGNPLTTTDLPATNISGVQIDTTAPALGSPAISYAVSKTNNSTISANISATDNFGIDDGTMQFSLNGGTSWCAAVPYASTHGFDITSSACGGSSSNGIKTVTVRFIDQAGNVSATEDAQIEYDSLNPALQSIVADLASGTYGPSTSMLITATYDEQILDGSTVTIQLDNGTQITLDTLANGNQLVGTYTAGATGSGEDSDDLSVSSIISQSVSDTSSPANIQNGTSLAGITENIGTNKTIIIDVSAPTGGIVINNSNLSAAIIASDANPTNMQFDAYVTDSNTDSCSFSGNWQTYSAPQTISFSSNSSVSRRACLRLRDQAGNTTTSLEAVAPETPQGVAFTNISNKNITPEFLGSFFTWETPTIVGMPGDLLEESQLLWCSASVGSDCTPDQTETITDTTQNYYVFEDLTADRNYCYQIRFKNTHGDYSALTSRQCGVSGEGTVVQDTQVDISGSIDVSSISETGAKVSFTTIDSAHSDEVLPTNTTVYVYENSDLSDTNPTEISEDGMNVNHIISLTGLTANTTYYLKLVITDASAPANEGGTLEVPYSLSQHPELSFSTVGTLSEINIDEDEEPSVITDTRAVANFTTDQPARCFIDFKESNVSEYTDSNKIVETEEQRSHSITMTPLLPEREYNYKITCFDNDDQDNIITRGSGVEGDPVLPAFTTLAEGSGDDGGEDVGTDTDAPEITSVSVSQITGENATVTWNTNEKANSLVVYSADGADFNRMEGDGTVNASTANYSTSHTVSIPSLIPATKYVFSVMSIDSAGNIAQSSQSSFTTKQPSGLSSVKILSTALGQATVSWTTGENTSSVVEYGLTTAYGETKESSTRTKEHEVVITNLAAGETYHLRVKGTDDSGNLYASSDMTFEPKSPPKIDGFKVDEVTEHTAKVTFNTNVPTDAIVTYTDAQDENNSGFQGKPDYMTKHEILLKNLASGTQFGIKLKVRDEDGNETEENFQGFTTSTDTNAPKIEQVRTDSALTQSDKVQAIISWKTDENSDTAIVYKEGKAGKETEIRVSDVKTTSHIAVITTFKAGTVYYFNVKSIDEAGNEAKSNDFALLTPKRKENIVQIIINNFQDIFGWAQR